jgi:hypothetical protein
MLYFENINVTTPGGGREFYKNRGFIIQ